METKITGETIIDCVFSAEEPSRLQKRYLEPFLAEVCRAFRLRVFKSFVYVYPNDSVTIGRILGESHIIVSTYPECNCATLSLHSCKALEPTASLQLRELLKKHGYKASDLTRKSLSFE